MSGAFLHRKAIMSTTLFDPRKTKKITLPSFPGSEVEFYTDLKTKQMSGLQKIDDDYDRGVEIIRLLIKTWSFVDKDNKPLKVTNEVLGEFPARDFAFLMTNIGDVFSNDEVKKKRSLKK